MLTGVIPSIRQREASGTLALLKQWPDLHLEVTTATNAALAALLPAAAGGGAGA
jgi:hypothetical protein